MTTIRLVTAAIAVLWTLLEAQIPAHAAEDSASANQRLRALYESEWSWRTEEFADVTLEDGRTEPGASLPRVDAASQERRIEYWKRVLSQLDAIPVAELSPEERINAAISYQPGSFRG